MSSANESDDEKEDRLSEERSLMIVDITFTSYANFEKRVKALLFAFGIYLFICCILFVDVPRRKRNCSEV